MGTGRADDRPEEIGERLRRLRRERGLSQRRLAEPEFSGAYISRIEAGARRPSVRALRKLAARLGVSAEYLETGSEFGGSQERELGLIDAELQLRLAEDAEAAAKTLARVLEQETSRRRRGRGSGSACTLRRKAGTRTRLRCSRR